MTVRVPCEGPYWLGHESDPESPRGGSSKFPALEDWEAGRKQPTLKQLKKFANAMHTPIGYLFLPEPPRRVSPCRTFGPWVTSRSDMRARILDIIYQCQQRQEWYRDYARLHREPPVSFVGSFTVGMDVAEAASQMSAVLNFAPEERGSTWSEAAQRLQRRGRSAWSSGHDQRHRWEQHPSEARPTRIRGFALADELAPVIFINGSDTKAAQIFTLAHELVHIWLGDTGVDDANMQFRSKQRDGAVVQ